jgi:hypothetical protein
VNNDIDLAPATSMVRHAAAFVKKFPAPMTLAARPLWAGAASCPSILYPSVKALLAFLHKADIL